MPRNVDAERRCCQLGCGIVSIPLVLFGALLFIQSTRTCDNVIAGQNCMVKFDYNFTTIQWTFSPAGTTYIPCGRPDNCVIDYDPPGSDRCQLADNVAEYVGCRCYYRKSENEIVIGWYDGVCDFLSVLGGILAVSGLVAIVAIIIGCMCQKTSEQPVNRDPEGTDLRPMSANMKTPV